LALGFGERTKGKDGKPVERGSGTNRKGKGGGDHIGEFSARVM